MDLDTMIDAAMDAFKHNFRQSCKDFDTERLTPELAEQVTGALKEAVSLAGVSALKTFLEGYETDASTVLVDGRVYRFKKVSDKQFLTPFGQMNLERNLYQQDTGGASYVPLDALWGMSGEYATVEVREALLYCCTYITPEETVSLLGKCALYAPSATAVKHIVEKTGDFLQEQEEQINQAIRNNETAPLASKVLVASLDGVNVLLTERGKKRGRPKERPGNQKENTWPTVYKNASVASFSFYGAPGSDKTPERLVSRYIAQMPEENAATLKRRFEEELDHIEEILPDGTTKILLFDGARGLWNYVQDNPRFADYEMLIDFYHSTEHLSKTAELLFGKGSSKAKAWYDKYYDSLLTKKGGATCLLCSITYHLNVSKRSNERKKDIKRERTFFSRNQDKMTYADFRDRFLPIGSGPVEAACKTIVKTRLARSGMHWSWNGGQRILQLRAYVKSQRWDAFWQEYKARRPMPIKHGDLPHAA